MREIIFRGKQVDNGEWISGDLRHWRNGKVGIHNDALRFTPVVIPETVGQYTGLKDKNGRRIFEGDIIRYETGRACVHFGAYPAAFERPDTNVGFYLEWKVDCMFRVDIGFWANERKIEVIGNIHDNPELLKEETNAAKTVF